MSRLLLQQTMSSRAFLTQAIEDPIPASPRKTEQREPAANTNEIFNYITHFSAAPHAKPCHRQVTMELDVKAVDAPKMRQLAASICGDNLSSIRIRPISRTKSVHFWLSLKYDASLVDVVMTAIMRHLPSAQFGHFQVI